MSGLAVTCILVAAILWAVRLWRLPRRPAQAAGRAFSHAHHSPSAVVPRWKAQVPALRAIVELNMGPLSRGAATLEKTFLEVLINIFSGGTALFALPVAPAPSECCLSCQSLLGSDGQQFVSWEVRDAVDLWPEAVVLI